MSQIPEEAAEVSVRQPSAEAPSAEAPSAEAPSAEASTPKKRLPLSTLAIEVFSIVVGVLLALGVNEWRQMSANKQLAATARVNIFAEIESNKNHLDFVYQSNLAIQEWLQAGADESVESPTYTPAWGLQDTAWKVARDTGALQHLSYEAVAGFSAVYGFQQTYQALIYQLTQAQMIGLQITYREGLDTAALYREVALRSMSIVELMIRNEKALLESYDKALQYRDEPNQYRDEPNP